MNDSVNLVWLRRDLRLQDNHALSSASRQPGKTAVVFVFDTKILGRLRDKGDRRVHFIFETLKEIDQELRTKGSQLILRVGDPAEEIARVAKALSANNIYFNEDYEPYAKKRDEKIKDDLWKKGIRSFVLKDQVIFSGDEVKKPDGTPYRVFTPYKNAWMKKLKASDYLEKIVSLKFISSRKISRISRKVTLKSLGFKETGFTLDFQKPGRKSAQKTLKKFTQSLKSYHKNRDFPEIEHGTSGLSVHLRFGTVSIRESLRFCLKSRTQGSKIWLNELIWREFYQMILDQFPHVEKKSFLPKYSELNWPGKVSHFKKWCEGQTGFPIVDAAMRQLNQTGWMHNRLRMITASFLVKDLLIDWKKGESYFSEKLLDYDLASNNGGWQWCSSTGCDAQPYFRIFHPITQSKKYDPNGNFIRKWVPELRKLSNQTIHFPADAKQNKIPIGFRLGRDYPFPIVEHVKQREKTLRLFKRAK